MDILFWFIRVDQNVFSFFKKTVFIVMKTVFIKGPPRYYHSNKASMEISAVKWLSATL